MFLSYLKKESGKERTFIQIAKQKFLLQKSLTITISIFLIMTISSTPFFPHKEDLVVCCKVPPIDFQSPERRLHKWVLSVWMCVRMSYFSNSKKKRFEIANIYLSIQSSLYFLIHFSKRLPQEISKYNLSNMAKPIFSYSLLQEVTTGDIYVCTTLKLWMPEMPSWGTCFLKY